MVNVTDKGYLGNPHLKNTGEEIGWTPTMVQEYMKCAGDPVYFAENYFKIVSVDTGFIPIVLYDYQKDIIRSMTENRKLAVCTARQSGKTTTAAALILHYMLFNEHKTVALLANKAAAAREILDRIRTAYEALPKWLQQGITVWNKGSIELENGSKCFAAASSSSAIRGRSISFLYIDEASFLTNWEEFFSAVYPTISSGVSTKMLLTSTPNGMNHFYNICDLAKLKETNPEKWNGFEYIEVKWDRVPGRDEVWKENTLASLNFNQEQFDQEFDCAFLGTSDNLLSSAVLGRLTHQIPIRSTDDGIKQYAEPALGNEYVLIADVSRGKGLDYSAFSIFNVSTAPYEQVCTMRNNKISPIDFATMIVKIGTIYNTAAVLVEINDIGAQVSDVMHFEYGYENLLFTESKNGRRRVAGGFSGGAVDKGIRTTSAVKRLGCSIMKMLFDQNKILINDEETNKELLNFVASGDSFGARPGFHDDLAMTLVLFSWLTTDMFFKDMSPLDTFEMLKNRSDEDWDSELLPFGFTDFGGELETEYPSRQW